MTAAVRRIGETRSLGSLLPPTPDLARLPVPPGGWDAHDARVRAALERDAVEEAASAQAERWRLLRELGFPEKAIKTARAARATQAMASVIEFMQGEADVLVLAGGTGAGKTSAATRCAFEIGGSSPGFVRASELEARGRYDADLRQWLRQRSFLVVDDLGAEVLDAHGTFRSLLDEVVDLYAGDEKRLVLTANLSFDDVVARYGARIESRLHQSGQWGDCGDRDLRKEPPP